MALVAREIPLIALHVQERGRLVAVFAPGQGVSDGEKVPEDFQEAAQRTSLGGIGVGALRPFLRRPGEEAGAIGEAGC
jgi:hypothetical protein